MLSWHPAPTCSPDLNIEAESLGLHTLNTHWWRDTVSAVWAPRFKYTRWRGGMLTSLYRRDRHRLRSRTLLPTGVKASSCSRRAGSTTGVVCWERHSLRSRRRSRELMNGNLGHRRAETWIIKKRSRAWRSRDLDNQGAAI